MKTFLLRSVGCCINFVLLALMIVGCGGNQKKMEPIQPVLTNTIEFKCDDKINAGTGLEIDIIYVTYVHELREISQIGSFDWFLENRRAEWKFKETVTVNGGEDFSVQLDPLILKRTVLLVIYANFQNVMEPAQRQVIIDYAGQKHEVIAVSNKGLSPLNKALEYVK